MPFVINTYKSLSPCVLQEPCFDIFFSAIFICCFSLQTIQAQDTTYTYFDGTWTETNKENSSYFRKAFVEDSLYKFVDYYNSGQVQMQGAFRDMAGEIREGSYKSFSESGVLLAKGHYRNNRYVGHWMRYFENGNVSETGTYGAGGEPHKEHIELSRDGEKESMIQPDKENKEGQWTYYHRNGERSAVRTFENGKLIKFEFWDDDGNLASADSETNQLPLFIGGEVELMRYLSTHIKYPKQAKKNGIMGEVMVSLTIDYDGTVSDAKIMRGVSSELDEEALRVVNDLPKWKPGKHYNRVVQVQYILPIKFTLR